MVRILSLFVLFYPFDLWAAQSDTVDLLFSGLKMFIAMIIVIGFMLLIYVLNRKGVKFFKGTKSGRINIVEMRHVGGKKILCLVEVQGKEFLLGLGNERIDFLYHFGDSPSSAGFENQLHEYFEEKK